MVENVGHAPGEPTDEGAGRDASTVADLTDAIAEPGDGVHWTLDSSDDLNLNLVRLDPGHVVEEHVNREVDVVVIVVAGDGSIEVDGTSSSLGPLVVAHVPRGATRRIVAGSQGLSFFTVHRRRTLGIRTGPRDTH